MITLERISNYFRDIAYKLTIEMLDRIFTLRWEKKRWQSGRTELGLDTLWIGAKGWKTFKFSLHRETENWRYNEYYRTARAKRRRGA
jgi:hypothetical protein